jgi:hypothetical protein
VTEAQDALARVDPETMAPVGEGYHYHGLESNYGGVAQRWMLLYSEQRRPSAQRSVDKHGRKQSAAKALQKPCRTAFACEADAQHALMTFAHGLQAASLYESTIQPKPRYGKRGRPRRDTTPVQLVYHMTGALTSSLAAHASLVAPQSCFILATNELDEGLLSPQALLAGYNQQLLRLLGRSYEAFYS